MISNLSWTEQPAQHAALTFGRLRMPAGVVSRVAMICADAEVYTKGTTVFADAAAAAAVRPHVLAPSGANSWSPPV